MIKVQRSASSNWNTMGNALAVLPNLVGRVGSGRHLKAIAAVEEIVKKFKKNCNYTRKILVVDQECRRIKML
jgi:hypothetical protein